MKKARSKARKMTNRKEERTGKNETGKEIGRNTERGKRDAGKERVRDRQKERK
jgi:hypothetical protein